MRNRLGKEEPLTFGVNLDKRGSSRIQSRRKAVHLESDSALRFQQTHDIKILNINIVSFKKTKFLSNPKPMLAVYIFGLSSHFVKGFLCTVRHPYSTKHIRNMNSDFPY